MKAMKYVPMYLDNLYNFAFLSVVIFVLLV